jgi:hypothetical protein
MFKQAAARAGGGTHAENKNSSGRCQEVNRKNVKQNKQTQKTETSSFFFFFFFYFEKPFFLILEGGFSSQKSMRRMPKTKFVLN